MNLLVLRNYLTPASFSSANCQRLNYFFFKRSLFFPIASCKKSFYGHRTIKKKPVNKSRDKKAEAEAL
jgi:hypothetical protein